MARNSIVLVFAESDNDAKAVAELVRYINPNLTRVAPRKPPLVLRIRARPGRMPSASLRS